MKMSQTGVCGFLETTVVIYSGLKYLNDILSYIMEAFVNINPHTVSVSQLIFECYLTRDPSRKEQKQTSFMKDAFKLDGAQ